MDNNHVEHSSDSGDRGPGEHEGFESSMNQTDMTGNRGEQRFRMERLATGGSTTSAMTRDATRLRSVMGQASERQHDERASAAENPVSVAGATVSVAADHARAAAIPPLPELDAPAVAAAVSEAQPEHHSSGRSPQPTMLRPVAASGATAQAPSVATADGATRMRSVATLGTAAPREERKLEERKPEEKNSDAKKPAERPRAAARMMMEPSPAGSISRSDFRPAETRPVDPPPAVPRPAPQPRSNPEPAASYGDYRDTPTVAFEPAAYAPMSAPTRPRGGRNLAITLTVVVGTALGLGLYAGGGDIISSIFANKNEGVVVGNPSAVTERPQAAQPAPAQTPAATDIQSQPTGEVAPSAEAPRDAATHSATTDVTLPPVADGPVVAEHTTDITTGSRPAAENHATAGTTAANDIKPVIDSKPVRSDDELREKKKKLAEAEAAKEKAADKDAAKSAAAKFMVQVRATPDESEANLLAKKLRSKGMAGITVVKSEKNGVKMYRVRFGSFASQGEAQSAATRAGYASVWVIKK